MSDFRLIANGYVEASVSDSDVASVFRNLKALRLDALDNFELIEKGHIAVEVIREVKRLLGGHGNFRAWLHVNFAGGSGPLADVIRDLSHYLNGRIGHRQLLTSISVQENRLATIAKNQMSPAVYVPTTRGGGGESLLSNKEDAIYDYDLYRLMAGIAPTGVGRLFMLLGGETHYA